MVPFLYSSIYRTKLFVMLNSLVLVYKEVEGSLQGHGGYESSSCSYRASVRFNYIRLKKPKLLFLYSIILVVGRQVLVPIGESIYQYIIFAIYILYLKVKLREYKGLSDLLFYKLLYNYKVLQVLIIREYFKALNSLQF